MVTDEGAADTPETGESSDKPTTSRSRRLRVWLGVMSVAGTVWAFYGNVLRVQDAVCGLPVGQPLLSDVCGVLALGKRPVRAERIAWEQRPAESCEALREHIQRFPKGAYRDIAASLLASRRVEPVDRWVPSQKRLPLFIERQAAYATREKAQAVALTAAHQQAAQLCRNFAVNDSFFRVDSAAVDVQEWNCAPGADGTACSLAGDAVCALQQNHLSQREVCG
jgi:hypothetical protein